MEAMLWIPDLTPHPSPAYLDFEMDAHPDGQQVVEIVDESPAKLEAGIRRIHGGIRAIGNEKAYGSGLTE